MIVTKATEFKLADLDINKSKFDRTNLRDGIERYWVGQTTSNVGLQYVKLVDGKLELNGMFERTDILCYQVWTKGVHGGCNVFIEASGHQQMDVYDGTKLTKAEQQQISSAANAWFLEEAEYVARQRKYFSERPWQQLVGLTPAEAVEKLKELGW